MRDIPLIDIRPDHWEIVRGILHKHVPQYAVWAFGSRAKWTAKPYSDLDLAVISDKPLSLSVSASLADDFSESDLPWKVDVVDWSTTSESFRKIIERDKVVVQEGKKGRVVAGVWNELPFSEAVLLNPATPLVRGTVYPFVEMSAITTGTRDVKCSEHRDFTGGGSRFQDRDTLMARITPCLENGKLARFQAPEGEPVGHGSTEFIVIRGRPNVTDNDYAYYLTISPEVRSFAISQMTGTSGRQRVPTNALGGISVPLPPLAEQKAIAAVLGALDDKIELNRRMNVTLETMARALFQSWFVDFDPVRAKLDGRQPVGLDAATAALFPGHLEDSPLGHIPKGWAAGTVAEGFNLTMGQSPPGHTYNEEGNGLPFYQGRTDFGFRFPTRRIYCSAPTRYAKSGDTLISVRAPVGDINMASEECCIGRGVAAVRHKSGATSFTYHSMANLYPDFARFEAEGTVFGSINKGSFEKLRFVIPPTAIVAAYERQAAPLDDQIRTLENQSRTLATLRDTLLPKLLSGELSVANVKEEAASV